MKLVACAGCARHVRCGEDACPFCGAALPACPHATTIDPPVALSRAALLFLGATAVAACGKTDRMHDPETVAVYGPPPMMVDASPPVTIYGPAPVNTDVPVPLIEPPTIQDAGTTPVTRTDAGKRKLDK